MILALEVLVDLLGIAGAVILSIPVLKDFRMKQLLAWLRTPEPVLDLDRATAAASGVLGADAVRFSRRDRTWVVLGLWTISASYGLHIVTLLLHLAEK